MKVGTMQVDCPACGHTVPVVIEGYGEMTTAGKLSVRCQPRFSHICPGPDEDTTPVDWDPLGQRAAASIEAVRRAAS